MYQQPGYPPQSGYPPAQPGYAPAQAAYPGASAGSQQSFVIVSQLHGLVLDIERGDRNPGARVMPWNRNGGENQLWYEDPATGTIRSKLNGFCLDIEGDQSLRVMPYQPGDPNQQWERDSEGHIRNRVNRNKVLDIFNGSRDPGAKIGMWDANGGQNQRWNFEFVGGFQFGNPASQPGYPPYPGSQQVPPAYTQSYGGVGGAYPAAGSQRREFLIVSKMNNLVLDVKGGNASPGAQLITWNRAHPHAKNQLWYQDNQGIIRSALNDFAIDAADGQVVRLQPFNGGSTQQWTVDGHKITNRATNNCLDIARENHSPGTDIVAWRYKGSHNQHWHADYIN